MYGQETASFLGALPGSFDEAEEKWEFASPADASYAVKKATKVYGTDLVGIAPNDCGICITVCPYNKPQTWNHDLVKVVTLVPGLNRLARYFEHFFGFGYLATKDELVDFMVRDI